MLGAVYVLVYVRVPCPLYSFHPILLLFADDWPKGQVVNSMVMKLEESALRPKCLGGPGGNWAVNADCQIAPRVRGRGQLPRELRGHHTFMYRPL